MRDKLIKILNMFMKIGLVLTVLGMIAFPMLFSALTKTLLSDGYIDDIENFRNVGIVLFYLLAIPYTWIILNLYKVTEKLKEKDTYSKSIITYFRKAGYLAIILAVILFVETIVFTLLTDIYLYAATIASATIIPFIALTMGVIFLVVSYVYEEVITIKEENDLTI